MAVDPGDTGDLSRQGERNRFTSHVFQTGRHFTSSLTSGLEDCPGFLIPGAIHRDDVTGDAFNH